jgi:hypothetical protein
MVRRARTGKTVLVNSTVEGWQEGPNHWLCGWRETEQRRQKTKYIGPVAAPLKIGGTNTTYSIKVSSLLLISLLAKLNCKTKLWGRNCSCYSSYNYMMVARRN